VSTTRRKVGEEKTWERPHWIFNRGESFPGYDSAQLEMLESIRNCMEQIRDSQMLACSVAHDIARLRKAAERIDRRLAETQKLKGGRTSGS